MERASQIQFSDKKYKVFSDYPFINQYLKHERFEITEDEQNADIVWRTTAVDEEDWAQIKGKSFVFNQFPF